MRRGHDGHPLRREAGAGVSSARRSACSAGCPSSSASPIEPGVHRPQGYGGGISVPTPMRSCGGPMPWEVIDMQVILAKSAGFCYGVERAVEHGGGDCPGDGGCVMLGSIIHNANVVAAAGGAGGAGRRIRREQVRPGDTVIIRSHGETQAGLGRGWRSMGAQLRERHLSQRAAHSAAGGAGRARSGRSPHHHRGAAPSGGHGRGQLVRSADVVLPGPEELEQWLAGGPGPAESCP